MDVASYCEWAYYVLFAVPESCSCNNCDVIFSEWLIAPFLSLFLLSFFGGREDGDFIFVSFLLKIQLIYVLICLLTILFCPFCLFIRLSCLFFSKSDLLSALNAFSFLFLSCYIQTLHQFSSFCILFLSCYMQTLHQFASSVLMNRENKGKKKTCGEIFHPLLHFDQTH